MHPFRARAARAAPAAPAEEQADGDDGARGDREARGRAEDEDLRPRRRGHQAGRGRQRVLHRDQRRGRGDPRHSRREAGGHEVPGGRHLRRDRADQESEARGDHTSRHAAGGDDSDEEAVREALRVHAEDAGDPVLDGPAEAHRGLLRQGRFPRPARHAAAQAAAGAGPEAAGRVDMVRCLPAHQHGGHRAHAERRRRRQGAQRQGEVREAGHPLRLCPLRADQRQRAQEGDRELPERCSTYGVLQDQGEPGRGPQGSGEGPAGAGGRGRRPDDHRRGQLRPRWGPHVGMGPQPAREGAQRSLHHEPGPLPRARLGDGAKVRALQHGRQPARRPRRQAPEGRDLPARRGRRDEPARPADRLRGEVREAGGLRLRHVPGRQQGHGVRAPGPAPGRGRQVAPGEGGLGPELAGRWRLDETVDEGPQVGGACRGALQAPRARLWRPHVVPSHRGGHREDH
mmetsp:Transcript_52343/g.136306  ORF Transcript_52343/g.136306 Transcript_52343/m.136306 type:complete len:457 (+) Transcript_52343:255-1625(+)